ncbi:MAG: FeoA domain-containing protein [Candidatus Krumholzibacteriia bacterium]|nr:DtxR family transcriptional regulator [bacterium]MCB9514011.1 DtxR family transcriptional regulator [Candidatus Latescibacterota bacterium]MCB9515761.1 DtxR family transcriptional regulator [Candidatus Latescibacterota bacterium]
MNAGTVLIVASAAAVLAFWPRHGLWARWRRAQGLACRIRREDALKHILKSQANGRTPTISSLAGALQISTARAARVLEELQAHELLAVEGGQLRLRTAGREMALHIVRAHRLWESYLAEHTGIAESQWHPLAEHQEHLLTPEQADALAARLGHPTHDPHGDQIPALDGALESEIGRSLNSVPPDTPVMITHIEDEPEAVYRQLIAQGLRRGMRVFVIEQTPARIRFWADGDEHVLAPVLAESVTVDLLPEYQTADLVDEEYLSNLKPGDSARVLDLSPACRGQERRRLLDLGFVPGTEVVVDRVSPAGDPTAYRLRGTVVALRREQAGLIRVEPSSDTRKAASQ